MHNATDNFKSTGNDYLDAMLCVRVQHSEDNWTVAAALARATMTLNAEQVADVTGLLDRTATPEGVTLWRL